MSLKEVRKSDKDLPYIIAMDFDGTLVTDKFPLIGSIIPINWDAAVAAQKDGAKLILWTCRNNDSLKQAVDFCAARGLHFDAINDNLDEAKILYGGNTRKIFADIYVDDRAALPTSGNRFARIDPFDAERICESIAAHGHCCFPDCQLPYCGKLSACPDETLFG